MRVASRVAKRVKTLDLWKLGNTKDNFSLVGHIAKCSSLFQKLSFANSSQKYIPKFSSPVQVYWNFLVCSKYYVRSYLSKQISSSTWPCILQIKFFVISFVFSKNVNQLTYVKFPIRLDLFKHYFQCLI